MKLKDLKAPGVDEWLISRLRTFGITFLTEIQRLALSAGVVDGVSLIVSAPTSTGKTLVGEIAVLCALRQEKKAIYLVSHKALADQKYEEFNRRIGEEAETPLASVGISTGDREEGDYEPRLLITTYEKALGLVLAGHLNPREAVVIADELQILGDHNRGPNIEALCALLLKHRMAQFIALTATIENPSDLAGWLDCKLVTSTRRDVPLHQEIWYQGDCFRVTFGHEDGKKLKAKSEFPSNVMGVVDRLIESGRGPILVFTETRREAAKYASEYSGKRVRAADGIAIAEQLDLFSEPTEASESLREYAERKVTFHSADLSPQERQVIEQGFIGSKFEVCFATSTLAAGVNFPFKSVVFPKLAYQYTGRAGTMIPRGEYRNMSGRAGRLGMHEEGFAILLPRNNVELQHANNIILPQNDKVESQLVNLSMRRTVLTLVASGLINGAGPIKDFFEHTLYWYQLREKNPKKLQQIIITARQAIEWLVEQKMVTQHGSQLLPTPLGKATSLSGLLPTTAAAFVALVAGKQADLEVRFDDLSTGLLYWVCSSDEFSGDTPTRFLPYPDGGAPGSSGFVSGKHLLQPFDHTNSRLSQCVHALALYIDGLSERKIANFTKVSSGNIHRLAVDVSWVLDGLHRLICVPDLGLSQNVANRMGMLSRRVRWGSLAETLDVIRIAQRYGVPGFGRQRALALLQNGLSTFEQILASGKGKLLSILRSEQRVMALLKAVASANGTGPDRFARTHMRVAQKLGLEAIVDACNKELGTNYENAIRRLLEAESSWAITKLDDGKRKNVPDMLVQLGELELLIECKTCTKCPALVKKEEAFAVIQKALDFDKKMYRVTLGKPTFDEHSKTKAQASIDISLVEHSIFVEGILRVHSGTVTPRQFLEWLARPGVTEIDKLMGDPTYLAK